jgi:hypothetical protein
VRERVNTRPRLTPHIGRGRTKNLERRAVSFF